MEVIPAIDLRGGRCVRLYQGDFAREQVFGDDAGVVAAEWQRQGATRIHVVDLDGSREGKQMNRDAIAAIAAATSVSLQVGGGVRDMATAEALFELGVERVALGTAAVEDPELPALLCSRYGPERVVVAVDARDGVVAIRGWTASAGVSAIALAEKMADVGVRRILYTDISRDGTLTSPNFAAVSEMAALPGLAVIASGGVSSLDDIRRLRETGAEAAIIGSALYEKRVKLSEAIQIAKRGG